MAATRKSSKKRAAKAPAKRPPAQRRPTLKLTVNGRVVATIIGPRGATDVHIMWGVPVLDGGGYFTKNGTEIPKTRFIFLPDINDFHFSPSGRFGKGGALIRPPQGVNDIEVEFDGDVIQRAWWTLNGERVEEIHIDPGTRDISVAW